MKRSGKTKSLREGLAARAWAFADSSELLLGHLLGVLIGLPELLLGVATGVLILLARALFWTCVALVSLVIGILLEPFCRPSK